MFFDPLYLLFALPGLLLAGYAQLKVSTTFRHYSRVGTSRGMSGAEIAQAILTTRGVHGVRIERVDGTLSDHYDPTSRTLRLSHDVYAGRTVAAAGVAAHEVGHALQHAEAYPWLGMRTSIVPLLSITSSLAMPTIVIGFLLSSMLRSPLGSMVLIAGLLMFAVMVVFQLVTLPVEFDASRRALAAIESGRLVTAQELGGARKVLSAAALTYVAAAISSLLTLMYFLLRSGLLGGRRE